MNTTITSSATNAATLTAMAYQSSSGNGVGTGSTIHNTTQQVAQSRTQSEPPTLSELKKLVSEGTALFHDMGSNLEFNIDEATNQVVVKIVNSQTGELVRQIPTVEMLDFIKAMKEFEGRIGKLINDKT